MRNLNLNWIFNVFIFVILCFKCSYKIIVCCSPFQCIMIFNK